MIITAGGYGQGLIHISLSFVVKGVLLLNSFNILLLHPLIWLYWMSILSPLFENTYIFVSPIVFGCPQLEMILIARMFCFLVWILTYLLIDYLKEEGGRTKLSLDVLISDLVCLFDLLSEDFYVIKLLLKVDFLKLC